MKAATISQMDTQNREETVKLFMTQSLWKQLLEELQFTRKHCIDGLVDNHSDVSREDIDEMKQQVQSCLRADVPLFLTDHELTVLWHANMDYHCEFNKWRDDRSRKHKHNRVASMLVNCDERFDQGITH